MPGASFITKVKRENGTSTSVETESQYQLVNVNVHQRRKLGFDGKCCSKRQFRTRGGRYWKPGMLEIRAITELMPFSMQRNISTYWSGW